MINVPSICIFLIFFTRLCAELSILWRSCSLMQTWRIVRHCGLKIRISLYWIHHSSIIIPQRRASRLIRKVQPWFDNTCLLHSHSSDLYLRCLTFCRSCHEIAREVTFKQIFQPLIITRPSNIGFFKPFIRTRGNIRLKSTSQLCKQSSVNGWVTGSHYVLAV